MVNMESWANLKFWRVAEGVGCHGSRGVDCLREVGEDMLLIILDPPLSLSQLLIMSK